MKAKRFLAADLFCGAGGFSTGILRALSDFGWDVELLAVNHWQVAIDTHARNHPTARTICVDVYKTPPREAVPGGRLDLLTASPTCTFFSGARGGAPISWDQRWGRMTPSQVLRWLTDLDVTTLLVENVPEFTKWGPVHPGDKLEKDGKTVRVPAPPVRNPKCLKRGCKAGKPCKRKQGYYFRPWLRRIEALGYKLEYRVLNAADYGDATTRRRFFLIARKDGRPITWPVPTHAEAPTADLFGPTAARWRGAREIIDWSLRGKSIFKRKRPLSAKTMARIYAGAVRYGWPEAFLTKLRRHMEAVPEVAGGPRLRAAEPFAVVLRRNADARSLEAPVPALCAGRERFGLVMPVTHADTSQRARDLEAPLPTVTAARRGELAFIAASFGERQGQEPRTHSVDAPAPTICARGRVQLVEGKAQRERVDVLFRMLQPHELAAAMGFDDYTFTGTKEEVTRQIGNAVPVRTAAALVGAAVASATTRRARKLA